MNNLYTITQSGAPQVAVPVFIDGHLTDEDVDALYAKWKATWEQPVSLPGGLTAITCEAILSVPVAEFNRTMGKARGERIRRIAEVNNA